MLQALYTDEKKRFLISLSLSNCTSNFVVVESLTAQIMPEREKSIHGNKVVCVVGGGWGVH